MKIHRIAARSFMTYDNVDLHLPPTGVVLVTGVNGAGKSSLVEAVASAYWGKTLRGTTPWRTEEDGSVEVVSDLASAMRERRGKRAVLTWRPPTGPTATAGVADPQYESTTKAQDALDRVVGPMDLWRRTHVFSSADAAHFTMATDGERKRLLESMLGLDRFDEALARCREELAVAAINHAEAEGDVARLRYEQQAQQRRRDEAQAHLAELPEVGDLDALQTELTNLERLIRVYDGDLAGLRKRQRDADAEAVRADSAAEHAKHVLAGFRGGKCPTCSEMLPRPRYQTLQDTAHVAEGKALKAKQESKKARADIDADINSLVEEQAALARRRSDAAAQVSAARATAASRKRLQTVLDSANEELLSTAANLIASEEATTAAGRAVAELDAVERVLGLKGVRAHVLGRALAGLEACANGWLVRIAAPDFRLRLRPYAEKKSGGVSDAIALEVEGAGGGHGYRASSGGERRRIDVALLMALAEVAQAAHGQAPGTLFFDEVFDALDGDGVDAVARVLDDLGRTRTVVVVSHSNDLAGRLNAALRLRVTAGSILRQ